MGLIVYDPQVAVQQAQSARLIVSEMYHQVLKKDIDYGVVPGTGDKPTLLKPGAEKLCTAFGLRPEFEAVSIREDFDTGLFFYRYRCTLYHIESNKAIATGIGSCSTYESKYRYRNAKRTCPNCGMELRKSKKDDGFYCWEKTGGCGANYKSDDAKVVNQEVGKVENPDILDQVNTVDKMSQKRALIAAVLIGTNASEFFTQDVEDLPRFSESDVIEADFVETKSETKPEAPAPERKAQPKGAPAGEKPAQPANVVPMPQPSEKPQGNAPDLTARTPDELKAWMLARVEDGKGANQGTIAVGQQKNIGMAMSDYFKNETVRRDFLSYMIGVDSYTKLNERQFLVLKKWLNETDPAQLVKEIAAFASQQQAEV